MSEECRQKFVSSYIEGRINYTLPFLTGQPEYVKSKIYTLKMKCYRFIRGSYCFREDISEAGAKFAHKVIFTETPSTIFKLIKPPRSRTCADYCLVKKPENKRFKRTLINASVEEFNRIPPDIRKLKPIEMKAKLKSSKLQTRKPKS